MGDIHVIVEHRQGSIREITLEMLSAAASLAEKMNGKVVAILLAEGSENFGDTLVGYCDEVIQIEDSRFKDFNSDYYQKAVVSLSGQYKPELILIGHTAQGVDFAPNTAVELNLPFATDVIGIDYSDGQLKVTRQYYQGKVNADIILKGEAPFLVSVRESCFSINDPIKQGIVTKVETPITEDIAYKRFIEYLEAETGSLDITKSDVLVAVGRGIQDKDNLDIIEDLAKAINADICGSRVAVDSGWIAKDLQVGVSGKRVKPKLYIAVGISGAFQHLTGMNGAKIVVAINKDPGAPIFSVANFGIVDDLFEVVPKLTKKLKELLN